MARYVLVGFDSDDKALDFLNHLHEVADQPGRKLRVASPKSSEGKVTIKEFKIRVAYLKEDAE